VGGIDASEFVMFLFIFCPLEDGVGIRLTRLDFDMTFSYAIYHEVP